MSSATNPLSSQAAGAAAPAASPGVSPAPNNQLTGNSFIQLLTAQLQAQDPLNPIDPTTFVTQLVQFNQLQQLIDINQTLSQPLLASPAGGAQPGSVQSSAGASSSLTNKSIAQA